MEPILIIKDLPLPAQLQNKTVVVETDDFGKIEEIKNVVQVNNHLFCIKLHVKQDITQIVFKKEWQEIPLVIYPNKLGVVRDLIAVLPLLKKLNVKFFLDGATQQNYEAVQILSSLGIYSGIVIHEQADWEKLTDLIYYALCSKVPHAPIEPFQYVYDTYNRNRPVNYGTVFFDNPERFEYVTEGTKQKAEGRKQKTENRGNSCDCPIDAKHNNFWQKFFYEPTPCAACAGWRICMGKYAGLEDKSGCRNFTLELLNMIENIKFKK